MMLSNAAKIKAPEGHKTVLRLFIKAWYGRVTINTGL
jgi:hypothetical protein